jgi:rare lipoprotein A
MRAAVPVITALALLLLPCSLWAAEPQRGIASYYAKSLAGNPTASGEPYDPAALTAAHRKLPLGTRARVTYLKTGKSVEVTVNDRGPHSGKRIIDLSGAAAERIGLTDDGIGEVTVEVIGSGS